MFDPYLSRPGQYLGTESLKIEVDLTVPQLQFVLKPSLIVNPRSCSLKTTNTNACQL